MSRSSPTLEVERFGCFGKLPMSREFIVDGSRHLSESGFDRWIGTGIGLTKARLGPRFDGRISAFPRYRFVWGGGDQRMLAGVICPSVDAAGRKHPFALFACLRGRPASALSTALQVWDLQERTDAMIDSLTAIETPAALREAIRSAPQLAAESDLDPRSRYLDFLGHRRGDDFWRALDLQGTGDGRFSVVQALVETLTPLRKQDARVFRGGIRYPLSGGGVAETAQECWFWLDLTERYLGRSLSNSWWFRSPPARDGDHSFFFLFPSPPSGSQWISLIDQEESLDSISYLDRPYGTQPPEQRMDPDLRRILESPASTLGDYVRGVGGS